MDIRRRSMLDALVLLTAGLSLPMIRARPAHAQATEGDPGSALGDNGFDLRRTLVPRGEILRGGPPRDGIPSIDAPRFVAARDARLKPDDRVLGLRVGDTARAYPIRILNWHEVVNDRFGDQPVVVTYCPLCGTGVVFDARVGGHALQFGVSGLLYNSDVLVYDRQTESLWSQLENRAVSGPMLGARLEMLPAEHTAWALWRRRHPRTQVLSFETGFARDYDRDPYAGYERDPQTFFPVANADARRAPKDWVLGVRAGGHAKAYPFDELARAGEVVRDTVGDLTVNIHYDAAHRSARVLDDDGREHPTVAAFWFAWAAFNPGTQLYAAPPGQRSGQP